MPGQQFTPAFWLLVELPPQHRGGQFPFPIKYAAESGSFDLQFPVLKSDTAQPFKLAYSLAGLTMGDEIWALFDPEAKLPRDPASLDIDVAEIGTLFVRNRHAEPDRVLHDGEAVAIFPLVGGG